MPPGPRSVQTEVNATRILLPALTAAPGPGEKALTNGCAFLLLGAGLAVPEACGKRTGVLGDALVLHVAAGVVGHAESQASRLTSVPGEASVAHWDQADRTDLLSPGWCLGECLNAQSGDVSGVRVVEQKNLPAFFGAIQL